MKTINFITVHYIPENSVGTYRALSFINELSIYYKINVICLTEKGIVAKEKKCTDYKNISIYYINQNNYDGNAFISRALQEIKYCRKLIKLSKTIHSNITIVTIPYMFLIPLVGYNILGTKILDIRDLQWECLNNKSFINKVIKKILTLIMGVTMKKFNHIVTANISQEHILKTKYALKNISTISNGISKIRYSILAKNSFNHSNNFTVTYAGTVGVAQNLKVLIDAAKELPYIKFIIIGDGIQTNLLREYANKDNIKNILFTGYITWDEVIEYYKNTSILYTQLDETCSSAMPVKIYEYSVTGLPIIYAGYGIAKSFIKSLNNATVINPNDVDLLIQSIQKYKRMGSKISEKNKLLIKKEFIREQIAKKFVKIVNDTV